MLGGGGCSWMDVGGAGWSWIELVGGGCTVLQYPFLIRPVQFY